MNREHYSSENQQRRARTYWGTTCIVPDCGKTVLSKRLCEEHFVCKAPGCDRAPTHSSRLCGTHYMRQVRWGTYEDIDHRKKPPRICLGEDCDRKAIAFGLCQKHYTRQIKFGSTELPQKEVIIRVCACGCGTPLPKGRVKYALREHGTEDARFRKYGINRTIYLSMIQDQGDVCPICKQPAPDGKWHIDHCHDTGKVRGILCNNCNAGIGYLGDDPVRARSAAEYLEASA